MPDSDAPAKTGSVLQRMRARNARTRLAAVESREMAATGLQINPDGGITVAGQRVGTIPKQGRVAVNRWNALSIGTFWRCVNLLGGALGQMPLIARNWDGQPLADGYYFPMLAEPDPDLSRFAAIKQIMTGLLVDGEAHALVTSRGPSGEAETLKVLGALDATPEIDPITRRVTAWSVYGRRVGPREVMWFRGLVFPGEVRPLNPIWYMERILSNAIAQDESAVETLVSGALPIGYFTHSQKPSKDAVDDTKQAWRDNVSGRSKEPPVFMGGLQYHSLEHDPASLQMLPSRQWTAQEVAMAMGVSPSLIGLPSDNSRTYSSTLLEAKAFVTWSLSDWMANIAGEFSRQLPPGVECDFSAAKLLEPTRKERAEAHALAVEHGWMMPEEVRQEEGLPPRDDLPDIDDLPTAKVIRQLLGKNPDPSPNPEMAQAA